MPLLVLIVEDEADPRAVLIGMMRARGYDTLALAFGAEAVREVQKRRPDVVLLDLMLPDVDGFTICEQLKLNRETNLIPVVMVTALGDLQHHVRGIRVGANGYLTKPFTADQLYTAIDDAMVWRKAHLERGVTSEIQFAVRSELAYLQEINDMLADLFLHTPLTNRQIKDLKQAVMEMGSNAIEWGHRKNAELQLKITYRIEPKRVALVIKDQGPGFNPRELPHAAHEENPIGHLEVRQELGIREGGFGIMLARGLVDEFRYNDTGNEVTLIKQFEIDGNAQAGDDGS